MGAFGQRRAPNFAVSKEAFVKNELQLKKRRDKLSKDPQLFSGLVWTGEQALKLGLVDEFGSAGSVAREVIHADKIVDFTPRDYSVEGLLKRSGVSMLSEFLGTRGWSW